MASNKASLELSIHFKQGDWFFEDVKKHSRRCQKVSKGISIVSLNSSKCSTYLQRCHRTHKRDYRYIYSHTVLSKNWRTVAKQLGVKNSTHFFNFEIFLELSILVIRTPEKYVFGFFWLFKTHPKSFRTIWATSERSWLYWNDSVALNKVSIEISTQFKLKKVHLWVFYALLEKV